MVFVGCRLDSKKEIPADMFRRLSIALLAVAVSVPLSNAQRRGAMEAPVSGAHAGFTGGIARGIGPHYGRREFTRGILLGSPWSYSDYDPGDPYVVEGAPPEFVILQPASADDSARRAKPAPLLIEWRGDRYVRFGGVEQADAPGASVHPDYAEPTVTRAPSKAPARPLTSATREEPSASLRELPPAVLVYRDGHREEVADYAIADGVIYVRGNDWQNGHWTKRIPLSALDPPATLQANRQRGVKFLLPSAPNVVIASF